MLHAHYKSTKTKWPHHEKKEGWIVADRWLPEQVRAVI
jgi:hypothetical protein